MVVDSGHVSLSVQNCCSCSCYSNHEFGCQDPLQGFHCLCCDFKRVNPLFSEMTVGEIQICIPSEHMLHDSCRGSAAEHGLLKL